jgi:hypothetical protein
MVLDAYGWTDIRPTCEFIAEFADEEEDDDNVRQRKKKYRYRWPDEIRDEVLARLLQLNRERALEEGHGDGGEEANALSPETKPNTTKKRQSKKNKATEDVATGLFAVGPEEA